MSDNPNGNWLLKSFYICLIASVLAFGITQALKALGVDIKVFNPLSDLIAKYDKKGAEVNIQLTDSLSTHIQQNDSLALSEGSTSTTLTNVHSVDGISIEVLMDSTSRLFDFTPTQDTASKIRELLQNAKSQPLHIAFIGDSFIEGDIFVGDFRRILQQKYGGGGVGYLPATSATARFRNTIKHRFSGNWTNISLLHKGAFTLAGHRDLLQGEGQVTYYGPNKSGGMTNVGVVEMVYESEAPSQVILTLNDSIVSTQELQPTGKGVLASISKHASTINSVKIEAVSDHFTVHGVYLDGTVGVSVDNISTRGSSGGELVRVNSSLIDQMKVIRDYQVIIVSFGLNALASEENNDSYDWYYVKMKKSLQHLKELYPNAVILMLSVSDRATIVDGKVTTLSGVYKVRAHQIKLAREVGCLFWDTFSVMKDMGGIEALVQKGWAAKDYTHISGAAGRELAKSLYRNLTEE